MKKDKVDLFHGHKTSGPISRTELSDRMNLDFLSTYRRPIFLIILAAFIIAGLSMGIRQSFGLLLIPMTDDLGFGRAAFGMAMALQQIFWGLGQPLAGAIADKFGSMRVLVAGALFYAFGLVLMSGATTPLDLDLGAGLMVGMGLAFTSFSVVLGAVGRLVPVNRISLAFGLVTAGGSFGQFVMVPTGQAFIAAQGWTAALITLAAFSLLTIPLAVVLAGRGGRPAGGHTQSLGAALGEAAGHRGYWYLTIGFFVCGFQVLFVAMHFPAFIGDAGFTAALGARAMAVIGFFNIIGTSICGYFGGRYPKKYLLSGLYLLRSIAITVFLLLPVSEWSVLIFSAAMGLLWLGTIPLTSGLVAQIFGVRYMATLFGITFFSHQIGGFLGVWLGGALFDMTGSYDYIWMASIVLGLLAAALHLPITETPLRDEPVRA